MVKTHGLTHLAIAVRDPERAFRFYNAVFGAIATCRADDLIQFQTPGTHEAIVLQRDPDTKRRRCGFRNRTSSRKSDR